MTQLKELLPAVSSEAILSKSKFYMQRALARKASNDLDEYQLWASLALELLGKAALADIHPSLIVDPTHYQSLFAAARVQVSTDIKTIAAHTLFERLKHLIPKFEETTKKFCNDIAQRRNAELHSGEAPFKAMKLDAWEAQYWRAAQLILDELGSSLDEWLGAEQARAPRQLIDFARSARKDAAVLRVAEHKEAFLSRKKLDREAALADAEGKENYHYRGLFRFSHDAEWDTRCPACSGKSYLAGTLMNEEVVETMSEPEGFVEIVTKDYEAEEFRCPVCDLRLLGSDEIDAAGLMIDHQRDEEREREYEPDYGNC